jgi:hypothetical protein
MIIVLTNQGSVFVNEKEYRTVSHNRDQEVVIAKRKNIYPENVAKINGDAEIIENVYAVKYFSDSVDVDFHDDGNTMKKLSEDNEYLSTENMELRDKVRVLSFKVEDLEEKLAEYEAK